MNCPKCGTYMSYFGLFNQVAGRVFLCSRCMKRYTERDMEEGMICAGCGELVPDEGESLCLDCVGKLMDKSLSYENETTIQQATGVPVVVCKE